MLKQEKMKLTLKDIILVSFIVVLSLALLFKKNDTKGITKVVENTNKIDSLFRLEKIKSDSVLFLKTQILDLENSNKKIQQQLNKNELTLQKIKDERNKKDTIISFYNVTELEQFFSNRYAENN